MSDDHPTHDRILDLALGEVDEKSRDAISGHLALCDRCRIDYSAIAESVDHILSAAPPVQPPVGFSRTVLAAMGMADPPTSDGSPPADRRTHDHRWQSGTSGGRWRLRELNRRTLATAVAAVLALVVGAVGTAAFMQARPDAPAPVAMGSALLTAEGTAVGTVLSSRYQDERVLVVTVNSGSVGTRYDCQLLLTDGTRTSAGSWVLRESTGATWILTRPDVDVAAVDLVTSSGATWATATL